MSQQNGEIVLLKIRPEFFIIYKEVILSFILVPIDIYIIYLINIGNDFIVPILNVNLTYYLTMLCILVLAILGAYFIFLIIKWKSVEYLITENTVVFKKGILTKKDNRVAIQRIQNVTGDSKLIKQIFNIGSIKIYSGNDEGEIELSDIKNPEQVKALISELMSEHESGQKLNIDNSKDKSSNTTFNGNVDSNMNTPPILDRVEKYYPEDENRTKIKRNFLKKVVEEVYGEYLKKPDFGKINSDNDDYENRKRDYYTSYNENDYYDNSYDAGKPLLDKDKYNKDNYKEMDYNKNNSYPVKQKKHKSLYPNKQKLNPNSSNINKSNISNDINNINKNNNIDNSSNIEDNNNINNIKYEK